MDIARDYAHFTDIFPFRDNPDVPVRVLFYPVAKTSLALPFEQVFGLTNWDRLERMETPEYGTKYARKSYYTGPLPSFPGTPAGTAAQWVGGIDLATFLAGGYPETCGRFTVPVYVQDIDSPLGTIDVTSSGLHYHVDVNQGFPFVWTNGHVWQFGGTGNVIDVQDNGGNTLFGIDNTGKILTDQTDANPLPTSTPNRLPIYDQSGSLVGYVPVYPVVPPLTTLIRDVFTDTDGTDLASHTIAPTNTPATSWTFQHGSIETLSNQANNNNGNPAFYTLDPGVTTAVITCEVDPPAAIDSGLTFWGSDANNYWLCDLNRGTSMVQLWQFVAGVPTLIVEAPFAFPGGPYPVEVSLNGVTGDIAIKVSGTTMLIWNIGGAPGGTIAGLLRGGGGLGLFGTTWDKYQVDG